LKSRATISVLCPTAHPGPLVSGVLEELRAVVDEVIVAADARVGADDLGHYALVADRVLRYEHFGANRHWSWLTAQASADWLLLLDGDELPSGSFIEMLRSSSPTGASTSTRCRFTGRGRMRRPAWPRSRGNPTSAFD